MKTKYYAWVDTDKIVYLGDCDEAEAPDNTRWIFDEAGLRKLQASIEEALK